MFSRDDELYLQDILESIRAILSYVAEVDRDFFYADRKTQAATIRELEIIGEAAGRISEETRTSHSEVNWRLLKDFRNVLAHEYFGVNLDIVWDIVKNKLPQLKEQIIGIARM